MGFIDDALKGLNNLAPVKFVKQAAGLEEAKPAPQPKIEQDASALSREAARQFQAYAPPPPPDPRKEAEALCQEAKKELRELQLQERSGAAKQAVACAAEECAKVPVSEVHEYIFAKHLDPTQQEAFKALSAADRERFCQVYHAVGGDWAEQNEHTQAAAHAMRLLLQNGALHNVDSNGKPLIQTLGEAVGKDLPPALREAGVDKYGQLQQLLKQLAYPQAIYQGEGTSTCAPSSIQTIMASTMPGEYARIATELLFTGKARVGDDEVGTDEITLSMSELHKDDDGRSSFSQLVQGSLLDFAAQFSPDGEEYGGRGGGGGTFRGRTTRSGGTYRGDGPEGGLTPNQINQMYRYVVGNVPTTVRKGEENADKLLSRMSQALEAGVYVPAGLDFGGQGHAITVTGIKGGKVQYIDSVDRKLNEVPAEEFKQQMRIAVLPDMFARGLTKAESAEDDFGGRGGGGGTSR